MAETATLVGPTWAAEDIGSRGVVDNLHSTIIFTADGSVHGSGGCNRFQDNYTLEGGHSIWGPWPAKMACPPAIMEQEDRFHEALEKTCSYRIEGGLLVLIDALGDFLRYSTALPNGGVNELDPADNTTWPLMPSVSLRASNHS